MCLKFLLILKRLLKQAVILALKKEQTNLKKKIAGQLFKEFVIFATQI